MRMEELPPPPPPPGRVESSSVHGPPPAPALAPVSLVGASDAAEWCHRSSVAVSTSSVVLIVVAAFVGELVEVVRSRSLREMCTSFIRKSLRQPVFK